MNKEVVICFDIEDDDVDESMDSSPPSSFPLQYAFQANASSLDWSLS